MKDKEGKVLSPYIVSKAKYALAINNSYTDNEKQCTKVYWNKVIDAVVKSHKERIPKWQVMSARGRMDLYDKVRYYRKIREIENLLGLRFFDSFF